MCEIDQPITIKQIEELLYEAIESVEKNDLVHARRCVARANSDIIDLWRMRQTNTNTT